MEESKAKESRVDQSLSKQIEILVASVEELRDIIFNSKNKVYNEHICSLEVPGPLMQKNILESFPGQKLGTASIQPCQNEDCSHSYDRILIWLVFIYLTFLNIL